MGCTVKINVPVATLVTDDDVDNGPLRLSLTGSIVAHGRDARRSVDGDSRRQHGDDAGDLHVVGRAALIAVACFVAGAALAKKKEVVDGDEAAARRCTCARSIWCTGSS